MKITEDMVDYISQLSRLQLPAEEKSAISHRGNALKLFQQKLADYLSSRNK